MEALLQSGLAAKAGIPDAQDISTPAQQPSTATLEKDMANLVINAAGEQKYIGGWTTQTYEEGINLLTYSRGQVRPLASVCFRHEG